MNKILLILVGPKGSGKTHIGNVLHQFHGIYFLPVEQIWIDHMKSGDKKTPGWQKVIFRIEELFESNKMVMVESLGLGEPYEKLIEYFTKRTIIKRIQVKCSPEICIKRVIERQNHQQIPLEIEKVKEYNQYASQVSMEWDLVLNNDRHLSDADIKGRIPPAIFGSKI